MYLPLQVDFTESQASRRTSSSHRAAIGRKVSTTKPMKDLPVQRRRQMAGFLAVACICALLRAIRLMGLLLTFVGALGHLTVVLELCERFWLLQRRPIHQCWLSFAFLPLEAKIETYPSLLPHEATRHLNTTDFAEHRAQCQLSSWVQVYHRHYRVAQTHVSTSSSAPMHSQMTHAAL